MVVFEGVDEVEEEAEGEAEADEESVRDVSVSSSAKYLLFTFSKGCFASSLVKTYGLMIERRSFRSEEGMQIGRE